MFKLRYEPETLGVLKVGGMCSLLNEQAWK